MSRISGKRVHGWKFIVQKKSLTNDFDRFKVMLTNIKRGYSIRRELKKN